MIVINNEDLMFNYSIPFAKNDLVNEEFYKSKILLKSTASQKASSRVEDETVPPRTPTLGKEMKLHSVTRFCKQGYFVWILIYDHHSEHYLKESRMGGNVFKTLALCSCFSY